MSNVIPLCPVYLPVRHAHTAVLTALRMVREGGHRPQALELLLSAVADNLNHYVETIEGR